MKKQKPMRRGAGVLLPVASLYGRYGIGCFGNAAYRFVDWLEAAGQRYWQVLPLGPTGYGDSPYQSFSAFAGNPYFIDLEELERQGLLNSGEAESLYWGDDEHEVDYAAIYSSRLKALRLAYSRSKHRDAAGFVDFCEKNSSWLDDYCLFMAIKTNNNGRPWQEWESPLRLRDPEALETARLQFSDEIDFWAFCQYLFFDMWFRLKSYANGKGIEIIGDIPIYVAMDSADTWANSELFLMDEQRRPTAVAGVPPDLFSLTGQLWGNPLYNWRRMEKEGFGWWRQRMLASARLYDIIRIDHFIGIVNYYSIPAGATTALNGHWISGPGIRLLEAIATQLGGKRLIAEDLGVLTKEVATLRDRCGYPGMKLMQFAFDSDASNAFLMCNFDKNIVAYGGTHDNETLAGYFAGRGRAELRFAREYLGVRSNKEIPWALMRSGYESSANTVIYQLQDLLEMDNGARINKPSTLGGNWCWRMNKDALSDELAQKLSALMRLYGRE